mgnify:CR=1 FL=1
MDISYKYRTGILKTLIKLIVLFLVIVVLVLVGAYFTLNSALMLDKVAQGVISNSGLNIKYQKIEGGLFDGLAVKGFNYDEKVKADLKFQADFQALSNNCKFVQFGD